MYIKSPCVGICTSTAFGDDVCKGCGRTFDEVLKWNSYSDKEKIKVMKKLNSNDIAGVENVSDRT